MRSVPLWLCAFAVGFAPTLVRAAAGRCLLQVKHKTYLDGRCEIGINDKLGSFTIGVGDTHRSKYFAYVNMEDDGAHGYWNETPASNHAETSLGILKRHGACWENASARVCAYR
jgi:hypothetical protein